MAYIQADVDIMNMALRRVGAEAIVLSDANSPTSKPAKVVTSYYDTTLSEVMRVIPWNNCVGRVSVAGVANTDTSYSYVYSLASLLPYPKWAASTAYGAGQIIQNAAGNKIYVCTTAGTSGSSDLTGNTPNTAITDNTVTWVYLGTTSTAAFIRTLDINGDDSIPYKIEGTNLYCNETTPIKLRYLKKLAASSITDAILIETIVSRLASKICFAITGDPQVAQVLYQEFTLNLALGKQLCISEDRADVVDIMAMYAQSLPVALKANKTEG